MKKRIRNMVILAVDTTTEIASVACLENQKVLCEKNKRGEKSHSERLMPLICDVLACAGKKATDVDLFAVVNGPGSFTGIRIGLTAVKAMAYAANKPIVGVCSLDSLAMNGLREDMVHCMEGMYVCPMIDARNQQVYTCLYKVCVATDGSSQRKSSQHLSTPFVSCYLERITEYMAVPISELCTHINQLKGKRILFTGNAYTLHEAFFMQNMNKQIVNKQITNKQNVNANVEICNAKEVEAENEDTGKNANVEICNAKKVEAENEEAEENASIEICNAKMIKADSEDAGKNADMTHLLAPCAQNAGWIAYHAACAGKTDDPMALDAFYLRVSQAERLYKDETKTEHAN